jgi:hypothetical protein
LDEERVGERPFLLTFLGCRKKVSQTAGTLFEKKEWIPVSAAHALRLINSSPVKNFTTLKA